MKAKIGIGIVGGTGFGAGELLRLISFRDDCEVVSVVSASKAGERIACLHPQLESVYTASFDKELDFSAFSSYEHKVLFMALPHGISSSRIAAIMDSAIEHNIKIIDLSGDLRIRDKEVREKHYPATSAYSEMQNQFVYGAPELNKAAIASSQFVANCGCFALTSILAAAPLCNKKTPNRVVIDGKSGTSGAGKTLVDAFHHPNAHANAFAYKVLQHRHESEIAESLGNVRGERFPLSFVPHVIPCARGIYSTTHMFLDEELEQEEVEAMYKEFYSDAPFVRIVGAAPHLHSVVGSNFCDISVFVRGKDVVAIAALDNLIKGMCGNALQNMNLMCGVEETAGLQVSGMGPI